ncbi:hypothetical protein FOMPIDRAFT_1017328 [Fomitopsis schrenkii]|uniref:Lysophospholipase n=1 Tax=Fomitopsis schrenkii TaxID=2126942 RepID=S8E1E0_FOMSC|nr:hypothetical protein FOMPIDRAFT_1017328 [Fomitopsis schrenkii]
MAFFVHVLAALLCCDPLLAAAQAAAAAAYAPQLAPCPAGFSLIREAGTKAASQSLSYGESQYLSGKQSTVLPNAWKSYLFTVEGTANGNELPSYVSRILGGDYGSMAYPRLGIATSGGGYRAATFGAGVLNALDGRNSSAVSAGTGGLLQAATYLAGLSGGSWLLTYTADELQAMLSQTFDIATQGIAYEIGSGWEKDPEYPSCLACAVVDRARERQNMARDGLCASCLERYCWS